MYQFKNCKNKRSIGDSAFRGCKNLTNVTIPSSVRSIGASAFFNCRVVNKLNINTNNLSNIAMDSFSCLGNLNEVVIPKGVKHFHLEHSVIH